MSAEPGPRLSPGLAPSRLRDGRGASPRARQDADGSPSAEGAAGRRPTRQPPREGRRPRGRARSPRGPPGPLLAGSSRGRPRPAQSRRARASPGALRAGGVSGMSGARGAGDPRCQAALAVLASLCRARPPPLGLDAETCRGFELQTPERSPSAADAGNATPEAPSLPGLWPWLRPPPSPISPQNSGPGAPGPRERTRLGVLDSQPGPWPAGRAEPRGGDPGGDSPAPPCEPAGPRGRLGSRDGAPLGASVSLRLSGRRGAVCQGRDLRGERETGDIPGRKRLVSSRRPRSQGPSVGLSVRVPVFSANAARAPGLSGRNLGVRLARGLCVRRLSGCEWPRAPPPGAGWGRVSQPPPPPPAPITRSLGLPLTHSDSGPVRD